MQAVSGVLTSGPACLAACKQPTQAWKMQATTPLRQSAMRPVGIFTVKSFAGRQLRAEQWMSGIAQARGGAIGVEAKAVPVLSPVGDGKTDHLDEPTDLPGQIRVSDTFVLGRTGDRADYVVPVATVSGAHAKVETKDDKVYITDLDSTNGTYIDSKKISSNTPVELKPGSVVVFGDEHLAAFKLESVEEEETQEANEGEGTPEAKGGEDN